jgi:hypothetical protein
MSNDRSPTVKSVRTERTLHARRDVPDNRDRLHKPSLVPLECKIDKLDSRLTPDAGPSKPRKAAWTWF